MVSGREQTQNDLDQANGALSGKENLERRPHLKTAPGAIVYVSDLPETQHHVALAELRWLNGKLQQLWNVTTYRGGMPIKGGTDWRDVPYITS